MADLYPHNSQIMAKIIMNIKNLCNNLAINWGNNLKFVIFWDKTNKSNFLQLRFIGIKLINNIFLQINNISSSFCE